MQHTLLRQNNPENRKSSLFVKLVCFSVLLILPKIPSIVDSLHKSLVFAVCVALMSFNMTAVFRGRGAAGPTTFISAAISLIKTHEAPREWKTKLLIMWSRLQRCSSGQNHNTETLPFKAISSDQYVHLEMSNKSLKSHGMFLSLPVK